MRRPRHKELRGSADCCRHRYTSHAQRLRSQNEVTITVTEHEDTGMLIVELEGVDGNVIIRSGDSDLCLVGETGDEPLNGDTTVMPLTLQSVRLEKVKLDDDKVQRITGGWSRRRG